jgi:hypothetical protein
MKQPRQHLEATAKRAEARALGQYQDANGSTAAAAAAAGDAWGSCGGEEQDWLVVGGKEGSSSSGSRMGTGGAAGSSGKRSSDGGAGGGSSSGSSATAAAMWQQLERQQPRMWAAMQDRHKQLIRPLANEKQKQVCVFCVDSSVLQNQDLVIVRDEDDDETSAVCPNSRCATRCCQGGMIGCVCGCMCSLLQHTCSIQS